MSGAKKWLREVKLSNVGSRARSVSAALLLESLRRNGPRLILDRLCYG
jgi:hypothetical protein